MSVEALANVEAEAALLGALMFDNKLLDRVAELIEARDFVEPVHARIFTAISREIAAGRAANPITLAPFFSGDPAMAELGTGYLATLTGSGTATLAAASFARQVRDLADRRRLIDAMHDALAAAAAPGTPLLDAVAAIEAAVTEADRGDATWSEVTAAASIADLLDGETLADGAVTGLTPFDELIGPMRPGNMIVLGGRPGAGKTAAAIEIALGAARNGHPTLYLSLEMSAAELAGRMAATLCFDGKQGVPYSAIRDRNLSSGQRHDVARAHGQIRDWPLTIVDAGSLSVTQLRRAVRRHAARLAVQGKRLALVVIDYLQLLTPAERGRSQYENVSAISRSTKVLAKESGAAILALAQLSRDVEKRPDPRPMLSDLRDSGQIEADADAVVFVSRPDFSLQAKRPTPGTTDHAEWERLVANLAGRIDFTCAKRRNGRTGTRKANFYGQYQAIRGSE